jgi:hypothetical protein
MYLCWRFTTADHDRESGDAAANQRLFPNDYDLVIARCRCGHALVSRLGLNPPLALNKDALPRRHAFGRGGFFLCHHAAHAPMQACTTLAQLAR